MLSSVHSPSVRRVALVAALALVVAAVALPSAASAQTAPKIAVIDTQQIVTESETGKAALGQLRTLQEQKKGELDTLQAEIQELQGRINEGRLSLAEDKLRELEAELEAKVRQARRSQEDAAAEFERRRDEVLTEIEGRVMPVINELGEENGYTMIFRKFESGLIFIDEAVDITQTVIERLDAGASAPAAAAPGE